MTALNTEPGTNRVTRRAGKIDGYALFWGAPLAIWQLVFFVAPLVFLVVMTFWTVNNYRLTADFDTVNWVSMFSKSYVIDTYFRTLWYGALAALLCSVLAFPASYALAFKASPTIQRICIFMFITPFFTSYLVRVYTWQTVLYDNGVLNVVFSYVGLGPFEFLNTLFGTLVGYLTLTLPLVILLQYFSMSNVNRNLIEAAHNLGCGRLRTVFMVIVPSSKTGIILAGNFAFILCFGDLVSPTFLGGGKPQTLSILIVDSVKQGNQWPRAAVVAVVMVLTLIVVAFTALYFAYRVKRSKT
jgi:spermidine/putrescine transport system permease protein